MRLRSIRLTVGGTALNKALTWSYPNSDGQVYVVPTYRMTVVGTDAQATTSTRVFEVLRFGVHRTTRQTTPTIVGVTGSEMRTIKRWIPTYKVHSFPSREDGAWQVHGNFLIHDGPDSPMTQLYATAGCIEVCGGPNGFVAFNRFIAELSGSTKPDLARMLIEIGASGCLHITYEKATPPPLALWR